MARRMVDIFARLLADDTGFEADVVRKAQKAGDAAGLSMGQRIAGGLSRGATQIGTTLADLGKGLTKTGSAMTRNLTLPLIAAGGAAVHFALDFDTTLRRVVGLTDVTQSEIAGIREQILALGPAVGKGPNELAQAFYFVASAGFKAQEAMDVLRVAAESSASGLGDTQTVAQVLGSVINAYGHENITAARAADILTEAVSQGSAEADAFAGVVGRVVPVAASLGVSFDQVAAALAGMTLSGISADEAATALRQIFVSLLKPTSEANSALSDMGLSAEGLRKEMTEKGLLATLRTLESSFAGNEVATAAVFGNVRALVGIQNLLGLSSEQLNTIFAKVNDSLGRQAQAYKETEGPQRDVDRALADLQATAITLGADVLPVVVDVLKQIAAGAREVAKWWKSLDDGTRRQIIGFLAFVAVAGPVILLVGKIASGLGAVFKAVGFLSGAKGIPRLITGLKTLKLAGLGALGVVGALVLSAKGELDAIGRWGQVAKRGEKLGISWDDLRKKGEALAQQTGQDLPDAIDAVLTSLEEAAAAADRASHNGGIFGGAMRELDRQMAAAKDAAGALPPTVGAVLQDGAFVVEQGAQTMIDPVAEAVRKAKKDVADAAMELLKTLAATLSSNPKDLRDAAQAVIDDILHPFPDAKHRLEIEGILARRDWVKGLTSKDSGDRARTAEYLKTILAEYELLAPGALAAGQLMNPALQRGIDSTLSALTTYLNTTVAGGIKDQFDLADELELMGYSALAGYVRGLETARLKDLNHSLYLGNVDVHTGLPDDLYPEGHGAGVSYSDGLLDGLHSGVQHVIDYTGKIKNLLKFAGSPPYTGSREAGEGVGSSYMARLAASIRDGMPGLAASIAQVAGAMRFAPGLAAAGVPTQIPAGMGGAAPAQAGPGSVVNNTWRLDVNGVPYTFKSRADFIKALDAVSRFGGSDGRLPSDG